MRLIGLTGGIATGKSTVARMLRERGAEVIDSDLLAREVVEPGTDVLARVVAEFGPSVLDGSGRLDRARLGALVFADEVRRRRLEAITHPAIGELMRERIAAALAGPAPLVVVDIPLLFEGGWQRMVEGVLVVYACEATQLRRMVERDGLDEAQARTRLASQLPVDGKRALATWVVDNGGSLADTERQVDSWWAEVTGRPAARAHDGDAS